MLCKSDKPSIIIIIIKCNVCVSVNNNNIIRWEGGALEPTRSASIQEITQVGEGGGRGETGWRGEGRRGLASVGGGVAGGAQGDCLILNLHHEAACWLLLLPCSEDFFPCSVDFPLAL